MFDASQLAANPLASREDARRLLRDLFEPLVPCFSPGRAQVRIGPEAAHFDRKAAWFEGFARPLWGLAPLHAGGGAFRHWELYRQGISAGVDPTHPEFWEPTANTNQRSVEIAALGFGLALAPEELWEPLPGRTKDQLAAWLKVIEHVTMADNNWHFFPVMAGLGMERAGIAIDTAARDAHLARLEDFVLPEGWYQDGPRGHIEHYAGFANQFYGLIYAAHRPGSPQAARYIERAHAFAKGFRWWFGQDGAALAIGRSLTYRFAMAGFWAALAYAGVEALPWGEIRGLWARQIRWWMRQPIFDAHGRLSVGYTTPNYLMSEEYNSPGSPYWAFKAFLPLALPQEHPFWQAAELPIEEPEGPATLRGASMLVGYRKGDAFALPAAPSRTDMRNSADKYGKFSYSTRFGMSVEADRWFEIGFCGDNILALGPALDSLRARRSWEGARVGDGFIETRWHAGGATVTSLQGFVGDWELRVHRIETAEPLLVVESGHAVPSRVGSRGHLRGLQPDEPAAPEGPRGIVITLDSGERSVILAMAGGNLSAAALDVAPNTSLTYPHACVPALTGRIGAGSHTLATLVHAAQNAAPPELPDAQALAAFLAAAGWDPVPMRPEAPHGLALKREA